MFQRLSNLDRSFTNLESTAASLHALQASDAEAQMHLHSRVQTELQIAQGLLADITASAATLQTTVHDTSSKVAHMVAFGTFTTRILNWGWTLIVLFVIYHFQPKAAGYAAVALGNSSTPDFQRVCNTYKIRGLPSRLNWWRSTICQSFPHSYGVQLC